jgi:hypothetical protein
LRVAFLRQNLAMGRQCNHSLTQAFDIAG